MILKAKMNLSQIKNFCWPVAGDFIDVPTLLSIFAAVLIWLHIIVFDTLAHLQCSLSLRLYNFSKRFTVRFVLDTKQEVGQNGLQAGEFTLEWRYIEWALYWSSAMKSNATYAWQYVRVDKVTWYHGPYDRRIATLFTCVNKKCYKPYCTYSWII